MTTQSASVDTAIDAFSHVGGLPINLLNLDRQAMRDYFVQLGEKPYRGDQIIQWIHQYGYRDFDQMTNLSKSLRASLAKHAVVDVPQVVNRQVSEDGTTKWLMQLSDGAQVETVMIPEPSPNIAQTSCCKRCRPKISKLSAKMSKLRTVKYAPCPFSPAALDLFGLQRFRYGHSCNIRANRRTLCVSSQSGCSVGCRFCATGRQGVGRNLIVGEIIGQVWVVVRELSRQRTTQQTSHLDCHPTQLSAKKRSLHKVKQQEGLHDRQITNVVMMGMGEPLLNVDNVVAAMDIMMDDYAYGLSKYRVTLSTVGIVPVMDKLAKMSPVSLAVSLHAPNDQLRNQLIPINKKYPLKDLIAACKRFFDPKSKRQISFEYVLLKGVNDQPQHAKQLIKLLAGVPAKVNVIPFNPSPNVPYERSTESDMLAFQNILHKAGFNTRLRRTRGADIAAACGQLKGQHAE